MKQRMHILLIAICMCLLTIPVVSAQVTMQVDAASGTIGFADSCPSPRTSATYASIAAAARCAGDGDELTVAAGTYNETVTIDTDLFINAADGTIIDAGGSGSAVTVLGNVDVVLSRLTLTNGAAVYGGGLSVNEGSVELLRVRVLNNTAAEQGGGVYTDEGTIVTRLTTIEGNTAKHGAGIATDAGTLDIKRSTVALNTAQSNGGGIYTRFGTVIIANSTVSTNTAEIGGGVYSIAGSVDMNNATLAFNDNLGLVTRSATVTLSNTLMSSNPGGDCRGRLVSEGYNLIQNTASACNIAGDTTGNIIGQDALLEPLADNGGLTHTHALNVSPARDAGNNATCAASDQRGMSRPQGAACDIGAIRNRCF